MPYNEPFEKLKPETLDLERARNSLCEELQAINWYQERIDVTKDESLKRLLGHNRDEEKEHAAMLMEWIKKNDKVQDKMFEEHD
jgi:uncharacterized protein